MRRALIALLIFVLAFAALPGFAKKRKDSAVEARIQAAIAIKKYFEQNTGWNVGMDVTGKQKDVLEFGLPGAPVEGMVRFERTELESAKPKLKELGFRKLVIKSDGAMFSASFPKGIWEIPLE